MEIRKVLVIGYDTRHIVSSGYKAGYEMYSADNFQDVDLCRIAKASFHLSETEKIKNLDVDAVILGSGCERIKVDKPVLGLGNDHEKMKKVTNKLWLAGKLDELGYPQPRILSSFENHPAIAKPVFGSGGHGNFLVNNERDVPPSYIPQEYIPGRSVSVSVISTGREAVSLAVNEILVGVKWLGSPNRFCYCGNITPLRTRYEEKLREVAENLILDLKLIGSNGVDFVIKDGIYVTEVNPRFQGSLDTVEISTGVNVFDAHVKAFEGELPEIKSSNEYAAKGIVFATDDVTVLRSLDMEGIVDIPRIGTRIPEGDPVATAIGTGINRTESLSEMEKRAFYMMNHLIY